MDTVFLGLRVAVSLGAVLAVIWYAHRRITRGKSNVATLKPITVISRQGISQKAAVVIVEADGRRLVLGVTEHAINVLSDSPIVAENTAGAVVTAIGAPPAPPIKGPSHRAEVESTNVFADRFADRLAVAGAASGLRTAASVAHGDPVPVPATHGLLRGSILSAETWKLSLTALRQGLRT